MRKDWVVWCGCALLFGAGAIWGGISLDIQFLKVANIHDLFEIFSSAATIAAVFVAFAGVNAWRQQLGAESDHALAQRVAVASLKYKEVSKSSFNDAQFCALQFNVGREMLPVEILELYIPGFEARLEKSQESKAEFLGVLQECRAIWGKDFSDNYDILISQTDTFYNVVSALCQWARMSPENQMIKSYESTLSRNYKRFEREGWLTKTPDQLAMFDEWVSSADEVIRSKLIR
ncbi:hypothetical protein M2397_003265 [Pseudomonas sp. BIGb0381]|uniref:hypothetical protein n=1 Tax=Pseudomonas sp. BIGb0381 TaxID=2940608 RepID=UPI002167B22A|nr:hypothetical protein [Pseudomonas sp. BIGb0381]MCS4312962.1 hypothetical protein [Pseudomonas sp. BIGb0381]